MLRKTATKTIGSVSMNADTTKKISVIIPVYQAEAYLGPCIDSVLAQTYKNFELLLIDDGSADSSAAICDTYAGKDSRVAVFHRENCGVSETRNFGLQQASGDYILFVDADDLITPDYIEKLYDTIPKDRDNVISLCKAQLLTENACSCRQEPLSNFSGEPEKLYAQYLKPLITGKIQGAVWRVLYPARLIQKYNITFTSCKIAEDLLFFIEVVCHCQKIQVCEGYLYQYRQIPQSSSHRSYITNYLPDRLIYLKKLQDILSDAPVSQEQRQWMLSFSFQFYRMLLYMNATASSDPARETAEIDESIFGSQKISKVMQKEFSSQLKKKHRVLNFLVAHRLFLLIPLLRRTKKKC